MQQIQQHRSICTDGGAGGTQHPRQLGEFPVPGRQCNDGDGAGALGGPAAPDHSMLMCSHSSGEEESGGRKAVSGGDGAGGEGEGESGRGNA